MPSLFGVLFVADRHAVQFQALADNSETEVRRNPALQLFQFLVLEFDDFTILHIDDVVMVIVAVFGCFEPGAAVAEIVAIQDMRFLKKAHGAVYGRQADPIVDRHRTLVQFLRIGMIMRRRQDLRAAGRSS